MRKELPDCLMQEKIEIHVEYPFIYDNEEWVFTAKPLAIAEAITTRLRLSTHPSYSILLDWHNILSDPSKARMHMFTDLDGKVPFEEKLKRMTFWASAVEIFDKLFMIDLPKESLDKQKLEEILSEHKLPRPKVAIINTGTKGLVSLFESLNFPQPVPQSFIPEWRVLVNLARSKELINQWRALKGK